MSYSQGYESGYDDIYEITPARSEMGDRAQVADGEGVKVEYRTEGSKPPVRSDLTRPVELWDPNKLPDFNLPDRPLRIEKGFQPTGALAELKRLEGTTNLYPTEEQEFQSLARNHVAVELFGVPSFNDLSPTNQERVDAFISDYVVLNDDFKQLPSAPKGTDGQDLEKYFQKQWGNPIREQIQRVKATEGGKDKLLKGLDTLVQANRPKNVPQEALYFPTENGEKVWFDFSVEGEVTYYVGDGTEAGVWLTDVNGIISDGNGNTMPAEPIELESGTRISPRRLGQIWQNTQARIESKNKRFQGLAERHLATALGVKPDDPIDPKNQGVINELMLTSDLMAPEFREEDSVRDKFEEWKGKVDARIQELKNDGKWNTVVEVADKRAQAAGQLTPEQRAQAIKDIIAGGGRDVLYKFFFDKDPEGKIDQKTAAVLDQWIEGSPISPEHIVDGKVDVKQWGKDTLALLGQDEAKYKEMFRAKLEGRAPQIPLNPLAGPAARDLATRLSAYPEFQGFFADPSLGPPRTAALAQVLSMDGRYLPPISISPNASPEEIVAILADSPEYQELLKQLESDPQARQQIRANLDHMVAAQQAPQVPHPLSQLSEHQTRALDFVVRELKKNEEIAGKLFGNEEQEEATRLGLLASYGKLREIKTLEAADQFIDDIKEGTLKKIENKGNRDKFIATVGAKGAEAVKAYQTQVDQVAKNAPPPQAQPNQHPYQGLFEQKLNDFFHTYQGPNREKVREFYEYLKGPQDNPDIGRLRREAFLEIMQPPSTQPFTPEAFNEWWNGKAGKDGNIDPKSAAGAAKAQLERVMQNPDQLKNRIDPIVDEKLSRIRSKEVGPGNPSHAFSRVMEKYFKTHVFRSIDPDTGQKIRDLTADEQKQIQEMMALYNPEELLGKEVTAENVNSEAFYKEWTDALPSETKMLSEAKVAIKEREKAEAVEKAHEQVELDEIKNAKADKEKAEEKEEQRRQKQFTQIMQIFQLLAQIFQTQPNQQVAMAQQMGSQLALGGGRGRFG